MPINATVRRHGLDGRSLKQGEEGAISLLFLLLPLNSAGGGGYHPLAICPILACSLPPCLL